MSDRIRIADLRASGIIGVHEWERNTPQELRLHIDLYLDLSAAGASDELAQTIDYSAVAARVRELVAQLQARLIEHLAAQIAQRLLDEFPLTALEIQVDKPDAVPGATVSVRLRREH